MGIPVIDTGPMTVEEFYDFTDARPDGEKWELIDGEAVLNASPVFRHQQIVGNIVFALMTLERDLNAPWVAIPGIGARVSETSRPEPDVMVLPRVVSERDRYMRDTTKAMVLFEVASPSTRSRDVKWKRAAYTGMAALTHYVIVSQDKVDVVVFARENGFAEQRFSSMDEEIAVSSLGISLAVSKIYQGLDLS